MTRRHRRCRPGARTLARARARAPRGPATRPDRRLVRKVRRHCVQIPPSTTSICRWIPARIASGRGNAEASAAIASPRRERHACRAEVVARIPIGELGRDPLQQHGPATDERGTRVPIARPAPLFRRAGVVLDRDRRHGARDFVREREQCLARVSRGLREVHRHEPGALSDVQRPTFTIQRQGEDDRPAIRARVVQKAREPLSIRRAPQRVDRGARGGALLLLVPPVGDEELPSFVVDRLDEQAQPLAIRLAWGSSPRTDGRSAVSGDRLRSVRCPDCAGTARRFDASLPTSRSRAG